MSYGLGVDLGTTYTAAARYRDGVAEMVSLGNRSTIVPSAVLVTREGEFLIGEAALRRGTTEPERLAREFKRRIGDSVPLLLGGTPLSAEALSARLLRWVVDRVSQMEGERPTQVALTYPANWGLFKQELLAQVIRLAEIGSAVTLTEPDAAAISYAAAERVAVGEVIAVYDLGGGTFDAAILRKTADGFDLLGDPEGIERRGGIDFDEAVFAHVNRALDGELDRLPIDDPVAVQAVSRLRQDCVEAKEALSADTDVSIPVVLPHLSTEVRLTRHELEAMVRPVLDETIASLRRAITSANLTPDQINRVLLVGGSSRMPLVGQLLAETLGRPYFVDAHPKYAIALGAARMVGESWTTAIVPAVRIDVPGAASLPTPSSPTPPIPPVVPPGPPGPAGPPLVPPAPEPPVTETAAPVGPTTERLPVAASSAPDPRSAGSQGPVPGPPGGRGPTSGPAAQPQPDRGAARPDDGTRGRLVRTGLALVAAAAVLVVGVIALTNRGGGDDDDGGDSAGGTTTTAAPPTPANLSLGTPVPVGPFPDGLALDGGNVYVDATGGEQSGTDSLYRVDPAAGAVAESLPLGGEPLGMVVADGSLWVTRRGSDQVSRVDLASFTEVRTVDTPGTPHDIAFGAGSLWVAASTTLYRIDPTSYEVEPVGEFDLLSGIAATDDRIYVSYGNDAEPGASPGTVAAIDPTSAEVVDEVPIAGDLDAMAIGDSGLWVAQRSGTTVTQVDLETFEIVTEVPVEAGPAGIDVEGDRVWVINNGAGSITLIDGPNATPLATIPVGAGPLNVAADATGAWVALSGDDSVIRVDVT